MSILQYRYCPACGGRTYHRYQSSLRCRFSPCDHWECVSCDKRRKTRRRRAARLGLTPDMIPEVTP